MGSLLFSVPRPAAAATTTVRLDEEEEAGRAVAEKRAVRIMMARWRSWEGREKEKKEKKKD